MNQDISGMSNFNKAVNPQQFDKVVEAILAGKYSWACVLMLRIAGYNPLHYIPYRTYNRLLKENSEASRRQQQHQENSNIGKTSVAKTTKKNTSSSCLGKIKDLAYFEVVGKQKTEIRGGHLKQWLSQQLYDYQSLELESQLVNEQNISLELCELNLINN
ncbi:MULTISPECIES: HetP family heterocyst commitment protein [unclassified Anabaena]|uniref:HetP family heterocyst commitment protein n=1 Tax=unclassified Anabaena TaxID=2619674 RepID=UPI00082D180F|nr:MULTISPECIES: HetP family heterocyst commitment protein [unclassified Anabaena]